MLRMSTRWGRVVVIWLAILVGSGLLGGIGRAEAQTMRELFKKVGAT